MRNTGSFRSTGILLTKMQLGIGTMPSSIFQLIVPALITFVFIVPYRFGSALFSVFKISRSLIRWFPGLRYKDGDRDQNTSTPDALSPSDAPTFCGRRNLAQLKDLYYKLQNLEKYPDILPQARDTLLFLFSEALESLPARISSVSGILSIDQYNKEKLADFMHNEQDKVTKRWEEYVTRRRSGGPRELLKDNEEAKRWIRQISPVKYVDGAWLGHINKCTTPFALRGITKDAWQILSEEYGDGDLRKHHVNVYHELVQAVDPTLPKGNTADFIHPRHGLNDIPVWKAAVTQLLISLFPDEFLPEILGFNLHFEGLSEETLIASKELQELKHDPYYFLLHVCIDNADSGHTAMAMRVVVNYLEFVRKTEGELVAQKAWKRIQAGFILSQSLGSAACHLRTSNPDTDQIPWSMQESALARIFVSKTFAAHRVHCDSRMRVGRHTLNEWLDPKAMSSRHWQMTFLQDLRSAKHLVRRGESSKSKLIEEMSWRGRMFGSFTEQEVETVRIWIDSLPRLDQVYWNFIGQPQRLSTEAYHTQDIRYSCPVFQPLPLISEVKQRQNRRTHYPALQYDMVDILSANPTAHPCLYLVGPASVRESDKNVDLKRLLPLWFAHPSLLESFVAIPWKTANEFGCSIIRFIRAQGGFSIEGSGVAGIEESNKTTKVGLVELGLEMARSNGLPEPGSLSDALEQWPSEFARTMLHISTCLTENVETLLGLAWAFVDLHEIVASSQILSAPSQAILRQIASRERESLRRCMLELGFEDFRNAKFQSAYDRGRVEIYNCFR